MGQFRALTERLDAEHMLTAMVRCQSLLDAGRGLEPHPGDEEHATERSAEQQPVATAMPLPTANAAESVELRAATGTADVSLSLDLQDDEEEEDYEDDDGDESPPEL